MDTTVKRIRPDDYQLSVVQENIAGTLQQVLDYLNQTGGDYPDQIILTPLLQRVRGPGTPQSIQAPALLVHGDASASGGDTIVLGDPATATQPQANANATLYGNLNVNGITNLGGSVAIRPSGINGVIIIPPVSGPAFYITNVGGASARFIVNEDGSVWSASQIVAANMVSNAGFKNTIPAGGYWNAVYNANTLATMQFATQNSAALGGVGLTPFAMRWTHPGSIVGMSLHQAGAAAGLNTLNIVKNGAVTYRWAAGTGAAGSPYGQSFAKGVPELSFAAGDSLTCSYSCSSGGNTQVTAFLTTEMSA